MIDNYVMLSVDLEQVTQAQRDNFYEKLADLEWVKIENVTTTWFCSFDELDYDTLVSITNEDVAKAVQYAGINDNQYDFAFLLVAGKFIFK